MLAVECRLAPRWVHPRAAPQATERRREELGHHHDPVPHGVTEYPRL